MTPDPALTFAQEALGCRRFASYGPCATHGDARPCLTADALATLIEARDRAIRARADIDWLGIPVYVSPILPTRPSPGEDARRIVRHGLADVLAWLGEEVGPKPGVPTRAFLAGGVLLASHEFSARCKALSRKADSDA